MAISDQDAQRLNMSMPVAEDLKLGDIIQELQGDASAPEFVAWTDVTGKPSSFPPASHTHPISQVDGLQDALDSKLGSVAWGDVSGKPASFPPSAHTHAIADVTNLQTTLNGKLTASKAATQADSTATDVAGLVADFNALLAKLKTAGIMS